MERAAADAAARRHADHQRQLDPAAPVGLRGDGDDHVEGAGDEVGELQLDHRPLAHPRGADGRSDEALLGDRGVDHSCGAELVLQAGRDAERATEVADVLAQEEDAIVVAQRVGQSRADGVEIGDLPHAASLAPQNRCLAASSAAGTARSSEDGVDGDARGRRTARHAPRPVAGCDPRVGAIGKRADQRIAVGRHGTRAGPAADERRPRQHRGGRHPHARAAPVPRARWSGSSRRKVAPSVVTPSAVTAANAGGTSPVIVVSSSITRLLERVARRPIEPDLRRDTPDRHHR